MHDNTAEPSHTVEPTDNTVEPSLRLRGSDSPIAGRCGAKLPGTDREYGAYRYCTNHPKTGRQRCRKHGGNANTGPDNHAFKHGGYSQYLPTRMLADYERMRTDPDRLSLQNEMALLRIRLTETLQRVEAGHVISAELIRTAKDTVGTFRLFEAAHRATNPQRMAIALTKLGQAINDMEATIAPTAQANVAEKQVRETALAVGNLARKENERMEMLHNMLALDVVLADRHALVMKLLDAVDKHVADDTTRRAIRRAAAHGYAELTGRRDAPALTAGRD